MGAVGRQVAVVYTDSAHPNVGVSARSQFDHGNYLREVWGFRSLGRTRTLDSHASRLRRKLARDGAGPFVLNLWGVGYKLLDG